MHQRILNRFKKINSTTFWGDFLDARFYITKQIMNEKHEMVAEIGCADCVMLSFDPSPFKVGVDMDMKSLSRAKEIWPKIQCIQADVLNLPLKENIFPKVIASGILPVFKTQEIRKKAGRELARITKSQGGSIFIFGPNRLSKYFNHYDNTARQKYLHHSEVIEIFNDFVLKTEGYNAFCRYVSFGIKKILYNLPESFLERTGIEDLIFRLLVSKKYPKDERSYVIIGHKK